MEFTKYNHSIQEKKIYEYWEKNNLFKPNSKKSKKLSLLLYHHQILLVNYTWVMPLIIVFKMF